MKETTARLNTEEIQKVYAGVDQIGDNGRDCGVYCRICHPDVCPQRLSGQGYR